MQRLDIAIQTGHIVLHQGGFKVTNTKDMRSVFPATKSARYSTVKRSLWRRGFYLKKGIWRHPTLDVSTARYPCPEQNECHHQSELRDFPAGQ